MKTKYKYILLILLTFALSIFIYYYIEASKEVKTKEDILVSQNNKENEIISNTAYTIDNPNVILNPYGNAPLSALIIFKTSDLTPVTITIKGKDGEKNFTQTFNPARTHVLPIYGLYENYNNTIDIKAGDDTKTVNIKTDSLPKSLKNSETKNNIDTDDLFFTTSNGGYPVAYDTYGNIRWYLNKNYHYDLTRLANGHLIISTDNLVSTKDYTTGLYEIDMLGKIYYEYNLEGGYYGNVFELANGNLLVSTNNFEGGTLEDYLVELDRTTGEIIKKFDIYNLVPAGDETNWFSLNSFVYDSKTNSITLIGSKKDYIINIDYTSGEMNYIIGKNIPKKYTKYALKTDDNVYPIKPESLVLLDNGNIAFLSENKLIEYSINLDNHTFSLVQNTDIEDNIKNSSLSYSASQDFILSTENKIKIIKDGKTKEVMNTQKDIDTVKLYPLYDTDIYSTEKGERLGSLGETETVKNNTVLFAKSENIMKKYNISIYKDASRLALTGTFKKGDDVKIILDNVFDKKTYDVKISSSAYVKDDTHKKNDKIKTTTYINNTNISGKYYIYLKINDTVYKLYKSVTF